MLLEGVVLMAKGEDMLAGVVVASLCAHEDCRSLNLSSLRR